VKVQQNDGRITEITVEGTLYSPALCEGFGITYTFLLRRRP